MLTVIFSSTRRGAQPDKRRASNPERKASSWRTFNVRTSARREEGESLAFLERSSAFFNLSEWTARQEEGEQFREEGEQLTHFHSSIFYDLAGRAARQEEGDQHVSSWRTFNVRCYRRDERKASLPSTFFGFKTIRGGRAIPGGRRAAPGGRRAADARSLFYFLQLGLARSKTREGRAIPRGSRAAVLYSFREHYIEENRDRGHYAITSFF
jgi:hypothetical protein